jgi:hypothetical protein
MPLEKEEEEYYWKLSRDRVRGSAEYIVLVEEMGIYCSTRVIYLYEHKIFGAREIGGWLLIN